MTAPEVKKNMTQRATSSNSANIGTFNSTLPKGNINVFDNTPFTSSRINPSYGNIGSNVTKMDMKTKDVFSLAYGNGCKYQNPSYNLSDLYNTNNYNSGNKKSGWTKFMNALSGIFMIGTIGTMGVGLFNSISGLLGKNKSGKGEETTQKGGNTVVVDGAGKGNTAKTKASSTVEIDGLDNEIKDTKSLLKSENKDEIEQNITELQDNIDNAEEMQAGIGEKINAQTDKVLKARGEEEKAKTDYDTMHDSVKTKDKEAQKLNDAFEKAKDNESKQLKNYTNAASEYDKAKLAMGNMKSDDPQYGEMQTKVSNLLNKKNEAYREYKKAIEDKVKAQEAFGVAADELKNLQDKEKELLTAYNDKKEATTKEEQTLKDLQLNEKKLPDKIAKAKSAQIELKNRLDALKIREDVELGAKKKDDTPDAEDEE